MQINIKGPLIVKEKVSEKKNEMKDEQKRKKPPQTFQYELV